MTHTGALIGGPRDGTLLHLDDDQHEVTVLEQHDTPAARNRTGLNRLELPRPWIEVRYRWDGTTTVFGERRLVRVKP
jgi:hypothetical protein